MLMTDDRNLYRCGSQPIHFVTLSTKHGNNSISYDDYYGAVVGFTNEQYKKCNGFSNLYFGWGGEDDDLGIRVVSAGMKFVRPKKEIGKYVALLHDEDVSNQQNPNRYALLSHAKARWMEEGLDSIKFIRLALEYRKLYTWILIGVEEYALVKISVENNKVENMQKCSSCKSMMCSVWKPRKGIIVACGLLVMSLAGISLTLTDIQCLTMRKPSEEENASGQSVVHSYDNVETLSGKIPSNAELDNMSDTDVEDLYWSYVNTIQVLCKRIVRVGNIEDGGKEVCLDEPFFPRRPCLVYSFGIGYQWDFDKDAARMFGCQVYSFDPSMRDKGETYQYADNITFYMLGLGENNEILENQWDMRTLEQIRRDLNHTEKTISILKIDIEGSEWKSIPQMVKSGSLRFVKQMQIELHGNGRKHDLKVLRMLNEDGFKIFMRDRNLKCKYSRTGRRYRTSCMEVSMIRITS